MSELLSNSDRRRTDRRTDFVSLADWTVPEVRKALTTVAVLIIVTALFVYMVSEVFVGVIAGIVAAVYLLPVQDRIQNVVRSRQLASILTIIVFTVPLVTILTYSWMEISGAAAYLDANSQAIARRLNQGLQDIAWARRFDLSDRLPVWVGTVAQSSGRIAQELRETVDLLLIGISVFLFTTFYVLSDRERILDYARGKMPGRYRSLINPITRNIRAVVYGVLYGTFLTQGIKSLTILGMNLIWDVPLAVVLAIVSFFIGLLPVVGSWTVYTPIAVYLMLWRGDIIGGIAMLAIGLIGNTLFLSMYLRPKIAASKSQVLNFYWMFIALITGVYTFGLVGIIIGPVLIAVLKAILDTITTDTGPLVDPDGDELLADAAPSG